MSGRLGLSIVVLIGMAVALPSAHAFQESEARPAIQGQAVQGTIRFELYQGYLIVAHGSVGPYKNLNFLVDTGATSTVVDPRVAQKLHLQVTPASVVVLDGKVNGWEAVVPDVQIGPVHKSALRGIVEDLSFLEKALPLRIDAIIGLDVLAQSPFLIDYAAHTIHFGTLPRLQTSLPLQSDGNLATVEVEVNHAPVRLLLDTGASAPVLFESAFSEAALPMPVSALKVDAVKRPNSIGDFDRRPVSLRSLALGGTDFGREQAFVSHNRRQPGLDFDGLINPVNLGITRLAIDVQQGTLTFTR